jgi:hypothetical protein
MPRKQQPEPEPPPHNPLKIVATVCMVLLALFIAGMLASLADYVLTGRTVSDAEVSQQWHILKRHLGIE